MRKLICLQLQFSIPFHCSCWQQTSVAWARSRSRQNAARCCPPPALPAVSGSHVPVSARVSVGSVSCPSAAETRSTGPSPAHRSPTEKPGATRRPPPARPCGAAALPVLQELAHVGCALLGARARVRLSASQAHDAPRSPPAPGDAAVLASEPVWPSLRQPPGLPVCQFSSRFPSPEDTAAGAGELATLPRGGSPGRHTRSPGLGVWLREEGRGAQPSETVTVGACLLCRQRGLSQCVLCGSGLEKGS